MKFAVSGVVPVKKVALPAGLPRPQKSNNQQTSTTTQWAAATSSSSSSDVVKVNGLPAKIEKIPNETITAAAKNENVTKSEIPMELERKVVSEKRTSIRKKNLKEEHSISDDTTVESKKSTTDSCEVAIQSTTKVQEGAANTSKASSSKAHYAKEVKMVEKEKSESKTPEVLQFLAEKKITATEKLGLNQINSENGVKVLERSLKLKEEENAKALISVKSQKGENVGGAVVIESKKMFEAKINNDGKVESAKIQKKQKITAAKPPKPQDVDQVKNRKPKNKSFDDILNESNGKKVESSRVTFGVPLKEVPKHGEGGSVQPPRPFHKTQSAMNVNESTTFAYKHHHHHHSDKSDGETKRFSIELTPEEIEEIQAKQRDAYDFGNLRAQLERRVSGDRPVNEYEEWRRAKAAEVRSSLHDSTNIKRAMKKWISMDKANRGD